MEKNLDEMSISELGELATQEVLEHIKTIKPTPDPPYIGRDLLGYRYNKKHPPMFDIHKTTFTATLPTVKRRSSIILQYRATMYRSAIKDRCTT